MSGEPARVSTAMCFVKRSQPIVMTMAAISSSCVPVLVFSTGSDDNRDGRSTPLPLLPPFDPAADLAEQRVRLRPADARQAAAARRIARRQLRHQVLPLVLELAAGDGARPAVPRAGHARSL